MKIPVIKLAIVGGVVVVIVFVGVKIGSALQSLNPLTIAANALGGIAQFISDVTGLHKPAVQEDLYRGAQCPPGYYPTVYGDCVAHSDLYPKPIGGGR